MFFGSSVVSHAQSGNTLRVDPANDYFTRIHNLYKDAVATKDLRRKAIGFQQCIPMFMRYIRKYPNHSKAAAAHYYLGESYYQIGEVRRARDIFETMVKKYKSGTYLAAASYRLAHDSYSQGQFLIAAKYYGITAANSNNDSDRLKSTFFQAQCLLKGGKEAEAAKRYKIVYLSKASTYRERAALTYAKILLKREKYAEAQKVFESLLVPNQAEDVKAEASYYAGVAANAQGNTELAEKYYKVCMLANTDQWKGPAQVGLMGISFAKKDYQKVLDIARRGSYRMTPRFLAKRGIILGQSYFKMKSYANAIEYFIDVEKNDKGSDDAFKAGYYKLLCFYNIDNDNIAMRVDRFLENHAVGHGKHKFIHQAILMKAESLYQKKKYKQAAIAYAAVNPKLIDEKYRADLLFRKARIRGIVENYAGAVNGFTEFMTEYPKSPQVIEAQLLRADAYAKLGDNVRALRDYDGVIKLAPKSKYAAMALQRSARLQQINKKTDDAIARYEKLVKEFPQLPAKTRANAYYWIGSGYFKKKDYRRGIENLDKSAKLDPSSYAKQIAMLRVIGYFTLREVAKTEAALKQAEKVGLRKKIPLNIYRWLGGEAYNDERYKQAAAYLKKGIEHGKPADTPIAVWRVLAKAQRKAKLYKDAFFTVSTLLSLEEDKPRIVDALLDKAKIQLELGKTGDAKRTAEAALEMNPIGNLHAELLNVLAHFYYITGQPKEAAKRYVLLVDSAEKLEFHPLVIDRLANCLEKMGDADEAARYRKMLKKLYPKYKREKL